MTQSIHTRQGLPEEMRILLRDYPRDSWPGHPNFAASVQNWMGAHAMFRQLGTITRSDTEAFLNKNTDPDRYASRLGHFGTLLVRNLHGHHTWEDRSFFPELQAADDRFEQGLETLEADHNVLDETLDRFTRSANRFLKLSHLNPKQAHEEASELRDQIEAIQGFLNRHLADEEDLVVPIILHYKLRG
ncbi:MAG: hemerythrin domain-containing protein [Pseudoruegeria sp.]